MLEFAHSDAGQGAATEETAVAGKFTSLVPCAAPLTSGGELSEEELLAIDMAYHRKKTSGGLQRDRDHSALVDQVQMLRMAGAL